MKAYLHNRLEKWRRIRLPAADNITLGQRRIFIFLTKYGLIFQILIWCMFVAGVNYGNNMLLALFFVLAVLFVISLHQTYFQLSGLNCELIDIRPNHVGAQHQVTLRLRQTRATKSHLDLVWRVGPHKTYQRLYVDSNAQSVSFYLPVLQRGVAPLPNLVISSVFPYGWMRAWSFVYFSMPAYSAPKPLPFKQLSSQAAPSGDEMAVASKGSEPVEFSHFRDYQAGDPLKRIAWKRLAQGGKVASKVYVADNQHHNPHILDYKTLLAYDIETIYAKLCGAVCQLALEHQPFALILPHSTLELGSGNAHYQEALKLLASAPSQLGYAKGDR